MDLHAARLNASGQYRIVTFLAVVVSGLLAATSGTPTAASQKHSAGDGRPVRYVVKAFKRTALGCGPDRRHECAWIALTYPVVTSGPSRVKTAVNRQIFEYTSGFTLDAISGGPRRPKEDKAVAVWLARAVADLAEARKQCGECGTWFEELDVSVETNLPFAFTISMRHAWYAGTPHPYEITSFENYHPRSGRRIKLTEIFKPGGILKLERMAERLFRVERSLSPNASLRDAGFFGESNRFRLSENFALYDHELVLYYNLYEIATYADGITVITIAYRDIRHLLRPESGILPYAR